MLEEGGPHGKKRSAAVKRVAGLHAICCLGVSMRNICRSCPVAKLVLYTVQCTLYSGPLNTSQYTLILYNCVTALLDNLTDDANALYMTKFSTISLYLTKVYFTSHRALQQLRQPPIYTVYSTVKSAKASLTVYI